MDVKPFRGLRPRADLASVIPSYPYDVVTADEARALTRDNPHSFLRVVRAEVDLDPSIDPHAEEVYVRARENFQSMVDQGHLVRDPLPAFYVYELEMDGRVQTGILAGAAVDDYSSGRIRRHEHTRPEKVEDRARLLERLRVHPGPVFLAYPPLPELNATVQGVVRLDPEVRFTAPDGVTHALWRVDASPEFDRIADGLAHVRTSYIADGHHRAAAAARVCTRWRDEPDATELSGYFLAAHFRADQLKIFDYNRVVADLNGLSPEDFLDRVRRAGFDVKSAHRAKRPPHPGTFGLYVDGAWHLLTARSEIVPSGDPVECLDVAVLTSSLLQPVLGIGDPRTDRRIDFVGGIRGMVELERLVDSGRHAVAFALFPTSMEDVMRVADAGKVMPPKSTWFEPKLRSGMVVL